MIRPAFTVAAAVVLFLFVATLNWAQQANEMNVNFHGFQDTRGVTVLSPTVDLAQDYTERTNLRINYGLDGISAASDSCARCHRDGINSHRQEIGVSATRKYGDAKLTFGGAYSKENFYRATTGLVSLSRDLANNNTTVAGGFSFSLNQPELHPNPETANQYQSGAFARTSTASWCWARFPISVSVTRSRRVCVRRCPAIPISKPTTVTTSTTGT